MILYKHICSIKKISLIVIAMLLTLPLFAQNNINIGLLYNKDIEVSDILATSVKKQIKTLTIDEFLLAYLNEKQERKEYINNLKEDNSNFADGLLKEKSRKREELYLLDKKYSIKYSDINNKDYFDYIKNPIASSTLVKYLGKYDFILAITTENTYQNIEKVEAYLLSSKGNTKFYTHVFVLGEDKLKLKSEFLLEVLKASNQYDSGILQLETDLKSITVTIDDKKIEQNLVILSEGDYKIKTSSITYENRIYDVFVKKNIINTLNLELAPIKLKPLLVTSNVGGANILYEDQNLITPFVLKNYKLPTTFYVSKDGYNPKFVQVNSDKKPINVNLFDNDFSFTGLTIKSQKETYNYLLASFAMFSAGLVLDSIGNISPEAQKVLKPISTLCYIATSATVVVSIAKIFNYYKNVNLAF